MYPLLHRAEQQPASQAPVFVKSMTMWISHVDDRDPLPACNACLFGTDMACVLKSRELTRVIEDLRGSSGRGTRVMGQQRVVEQLNVSQLLKEGELIAPVDDIIDAHWCTFTPSRIDLDQPNLLWDILRPHRR